MLDRIAEKTQVLHIDRPKITSEASVRFVTGTDHPGLTSPRGCNRPVPIRRPAERLLNLDMTGWLPFLIEAVHDEFLENRGILLRALPGCRRLDPRRLSQVQGIGDHASINAARGSALDSLDLVRVVMLIEDRYHIAIDLDEIPKMKRVSDLTAILGRELKAAA